MNSTSTKERQHDQTSIYNELLFPDVSVPDKTTDPKNDIRFRVERPIYSQQELNKCYNFQRIHQYNSFRDTLDRLKTKLTPNYGCLLGCFLSIFPFIGIMKQYRPRRDLLGDVVAGLTVGVMHIPQGMAYGLLVQLSPAYGLYASFFPSLIYFFLGTSRHISLGTFAVTSIMIGNVVDNADCWDTTRTNNDTTAFRELNDNTPATNTVYSTEYTIKNSSLLSFDDQRQEDAEMMCKVGVAMAVTLMTGIYQLLLGVVRAGSVTVYLSDPLTRALTTAASIHVFASQLRYMFGIDMGRFQGPLKLVFMFLKLFEKIRETNIAAFVMSLTCIIVIYSSQRWLNPKVIAKIKIPIPTELIVILLCTIISHFGKFPTTFRMNSVGHIPTGFPAPSIPPTSKFASVAVSSIGIAIVSYAISISMAINFAKKNNYRMDSNQELIALGVTNIISSLMNSYVSTASLSRSVIQEKLGGNTQVGAWNSCLPVAGVIGSLLVLVVILAFGPIFHDLPNGVLAAVVIVNLRGVFIQVLDLRKLYKISAYDTSIWLVTFTSVVLTDLEYGLFIGVVFSILTVTIRTQSPNSSTLGRIPQSEIYRDILDYSTAEEIPSIKVFSFNSPLYFINADHFRKKLFENTCNPQLVKATKEKAEYSNIGEESPLLDEENNASSTDVMHIILDCTSVTFVDAVGIATLQEVITSFNEIDVEIAFASCNDSVLRVLENTETLKIVDGPLVYITVHDAILDIVHRENDWQMKKSNSSNDISRSSGRAGIGNTDTGPAVLELED